VSDGLGVRQRRSDFGKARGGHKQTRLEEIQLAAERLLYAMESTIYFAPTIKEDGPSLPKWKREAMANYRWQELRALAELKRALGL